MIYQLIDSVSIRFLIMKSFHNELFSSLVIKILIIFPSYSINNFIKYSPPFFVHKLFIDNNIPLY